MATCHRADKAIRHHLRRLAALAASACVIVLGLPVETAAHLAIVREGAESVGSPQAGDRFGHTVAAGDFNGDGFDDLASAVPFQNNDAFPGPEHGVVVINFGSEHGITHVGAQLVSIGAPADVTVHFGFALCAGDFDNDGYDDLAVGAPRADVVFEADAGQVFVYEGSATGLSGGIALTLEQGMLGAAATEAGDLFGWSLACGNFDGDAYDDLAVGAVGENGSTGAVSFAYGSASGLTTAGAATVTQLSYGFTNTTSDQFGFALEAKDFLGDDNDDLAIGAPYYDRPIPTTPNAGRVLVVEGSATGLSTSQAFEITPEGIGETSQIDGHFGWALTGGRYNTTSPTDKCLIVIGEPGRTVNGFANAGRILRTRVTAAAVASTLDENNVPGQFARADERFGSVLASGRFAKDDGGGYASDDFDDIFIGAPFEVAFIGNEGLVLEEVGLVVVLHGQQALFPGPLESFDYEDANGWDELGRERMAHFGFALAAGTFDDTGWDNLAIGAPDADYRVWLDEECADPDDSCPPAVDPTRDAAGQTHVLAPWRQVLETRARGAITLNCAGEIVFSVRPFDNLRVASTTKVMTLLLAAEAIEAAAIDSSDTFATPPWIAADILGSQADLVANEVVRLIDLMRMTSSVSGNDAAYVIADALTGFNGGYPPVGDRFRRKGVPAAAVAHINNMSTRGSQIGMSSKTFFNTPAGRDQTYGGDQNRSTAEDMATLGRFALTNSPLFASIVGTTCWNIDREPPMGFFGPLDESYKFGWLADVIAENPKAVGVKSGGTKWGFNCGIFAGSMNDIEPPVVATSYGTISRSWSKSRGADMIELGFSRGDCPFVAAPDPPPPPPPLAASIPMSTSSLDKGSVFVQTMQQDSLTLDHTLDLTHPDGMAHTGSLSLLSTSRTTLAPGEGGGFSVGPFIRHGGVEIRNAGSATITLQITASHPTTNQVVMLDSVGVFTIPADTARALDTFTLDIVNNSSVTAADVSIRLLGVTSDFTLDGLTPQHTMTWTRDLRVYGETLRPIVCGGDVTDPATVFLTIGDLDALTAVTPPEPGPVRGILGLTRAIPNPFNPVTRISYELRARSDVSLQVFDVTGRRVRLLLRNQTTFPGRHSVVWDGSDDRGRRLGSGVYFYRLDAAEDSRSGVMHLVK